MQKQQQQEHKQQERQKQRQQQQRRKQDRKKKKKKRHADRLLRKTLFQRRFEAATTLLLRAWKAGAIEYVDVDVGLDYRLPFVVSSLALDESEDEESIKLRQERQDVVFADLQEATFALLRGEDEEAPPPSEADIELFNEVNRRYFTHQQLTAMCFAIERMLTEDVTVVADGGWNERVFAMVQ